MDALCPLASATELVFFAAAIAVALLLILQVRLARRTETVDQEVHRLITAQKENTLDQRERLEEATRAVDALGEKLASGLEGLEQQVEDARAGLEKAKASIPVAASSAATDAVTTSVEGVSQQIDTVTEDLADARTLVGRTREALEALEGGLAGRLSTLDERLEALESDPLTSSEGDQGDEGSTEPAVDEATQPDDQARARSVKGALVLVVILGALTLLFWGLQNGWYGWFGW